MNFNLLMPLLPTIIGKELHQKLINSGVDINIIPKMMNGKATQSEKENVFSSACLMVNPIFTQSIQKIEDYYQEKTLVSLELGNTKNGKTTILNIDTYNSEDKRTRRFRNQIHLLPEFLIKLETPMIQIEATTENPEENEGQ